jgi:hypothetical protein
MEFRGTNGLRGHRMYTQADVLLRTKTYGTGRICSVEGCNTRLSLYNPSNVCALHSGGWHDELRHAAHRRHEREEMTRNCLFEPCSREFVTFNPAKKYCSDACRMRAFQARTVAARRLVARDEPTVARAS